MSIDERPEPPKQLSGAVSQAVLKESQLPATTPSTEPVVQTSRDTCEYNNDDIIPVHCDSCNCQTLKEMRQLRDRLTVNPNPAWRVITSDLPGFEFH